MSLARFGYYQMNFNNMLPNFITTMVLSQLIISSTDNLYMHDASDKINVD